MLGRDRVVPESAGQSPGTVLRRKEPVSGAGADPAWITAGDRPHPDPNPRLQAAWDDHVVCGTELPGRQNPVSDRETPHACRVAPLPETERPGNATRPATPPDRGQLCDAQTHKGAKLAETASAHRAALHSDG